MSKATRARFAETVRAPVPDVALACLMISAEARPDVAVDVITGRLQQLGAAVAAELRPDASAYAQAVALRAVLGDREGFRGYGDDYADLRASLLPDVLSRRRGLPILLSVIYTEASRHAGIEAHGIGVPGHFVVGVGDTLNPTLLDPFVGGRLTTLAELSSRVVDAGGAALSVRDLEPWHPLLIITRVLNNIRGHAARSGDVRTRLWAADLALLLPNRPAALHRERGELRARLGDYLGAATDLEAYAEAVELVDDDAAKRAIADAKLVRSRLN
ncbi:MAG: transglutaminase-like domain-containing protein [Mycobacteriales bacterium]